MGINSRESPRFALLIAKPCKLGQGSCLYRPKGVLGKGVGNSKNASEMRQKCVKNAPKEERSKTRQTCVKNASKMRGTPLGENTFWTIPRELCERRSLIMVCSAEACCDSSLRRQTSGFATCLILVKAPPQPDSLCGISADQPPYEEKRRSKLQRLRTRKVFQ